MLFIKLKISSILSMLTILSKKGVQFYQMLIMYLLRCYLLMFCSVNKVNNIDFPILNKPCFPGINCTWSLCILFYELLN